MGAKKYPFGSCIITSVGSIGIVNTMAPYNIGIKCPMIVTLNKVVKAPWVVNDEIKIRDIVNINATIDHRFMDGGRTK